MKVWMALPAVVLVALAGLPSGSASVQPAPDAAVALACLDTAAAPPCGYIVPQITLDFPNKPACRAETLGGPIDLGKCIPLPPVDGSHVEEGVMRFSWAISEDGAYPMDAACATSTATGGKEGCIVITFSGTATNYGWMKIDIDPVEVVLGVDDLANPQNLKTNDQNQVWFWYEIPIKVTFTRTGLGDDAKSVERIERAQGATSLFVKAKSSASGQYYKEAFGVEEFRFDTCANDDALAAQVRQCGGASTSGKDSPGFGVLAALVAVGALALALRRKA